MYLKNFFIMINIKKIELNIELIIRGSIVIDKTEFDSVPDIIVKDDILYIIEEFDCKYAYYHRSKATLSTFIRIFLDRFPQTPCNIVYVQS